MQYIITKQPTIGQRVYLSSDHWEPTHDLWWVEQRHMAKRFNRQQASEMLAKVIDQGTGYGAQIVDWSA